MTSFYARLSGVFLVLIASLSVVMGLLCVRASLQFVDETEQRVNRGLAPVLAAEFQPHLLYDIDHAAIEEIIERITVINPRIEIYLLGSEGMIKAAYDRGGLRNAGGVVDTEPLDRLIDGGALPVLNGDPLRAGVRKPFSAARLRIMDEEGCYLYIVLGSERYDTVAATLRGSYILRTAAFGSGLLLLLTGGVGLGLFHVLTRRLRGVAQTVSAFASGEYDTRLDDRSDDEIGQLAGAFNRMADQLVAHVTALEDADRQRRELVANVSHDLRSPLASLQGYLETIQLRDGALSPEERQRYLAVVMRSTQRLNTMVSELFELSKLEAESVPLREEPFSLAELVQDVVLQFSGRAAQCGVTLQADLPDHLPPVAADIALIERALVNLIDNALQYTPPGGTVRLVPACEGDAVSVRIADTGVGIPEEDLPHVLERFYRVDKNRPHDRGGAGLGLAIASRIVELHGSRLAVESVVQEGTTFSFRLPAAAGHPRPATA